MTDTAQTIGDIGAIPGGPALTDLVEVERPGSPATGGNATMAQMAALFRLAVEKTADGALDSGVLNILVGARTMTVPAGLPVGTPVLAKALTATCVISQGTYSITFKDVAIADNLSIAAGEAVHFVVRSGNKLEIN